MKIAGIIAEYNPFHKGHEYHIKETKERLSADFVIVAMSGNFVQRGEPAVFDKYARAEAALRHGADMVMEIPTLFSSSTAEFFAFAGAKLLSDTGIVDFISFGSESGIIEELKPIADFLANEPDSYKESLKKHLKEGLSFPGARQKALEEAGFNGKILDEPNNILGAEYLKALIKLKSSIVPFTIKREGSGYNSVDETEIFPSAAAIRKIYAEGKSAEPFLGKDLFEFYNGLIKNGEGPIFLKDFEPYINFRIRNLGKEGIESMEDVTEGLENRIIASPWDIEEKIDFIKTKRYTRTKIQRMLIHILLGIEKDYASFWRQNGYVPYIKVLGFRKDAEKLLNEMKENSKLPVIVNLRGAHKILGRKEHEFFEKDMVFDDIYRLACPDPNKREIKKDYSGRVMKLM